MKEAIEKAIENGLFLNGYVEKAELRYYDESQIPSGVEVRGYGAQVHPGYILFYKKAQRSEGWDYYSLRDLIFGTDFIDKLVGKYKGCKNKKCDGYSKTRNDKFHIHDHCRAGFKQPGMVCEGDSRGEGGFIGARPALYHLQKMSDTAISRDIEKLKEYVRGLV